MPHHPVGGQSPPPPQFPPVLRPWGGWKGLNSLELLYLCGSAPPPGTDVWFCNEAASLLPGSAGTPVWAILGDGDPGSHLPLLCLLSPSLIQTQPPKQRKQNKTNFCLQLRVVCACGACAHIGCGCTHVCLPWSAHVCECARVWCVYMYVCAHACECARLCVWPWPYWDT